MTAALQATHFTDTQVSSSLVLKRVFGEGRKGRWESVQTIVEKCVVPFYGSQEKLLKKVEVREEYKCRLLYEKENPIGVLIWKYNSKAHALKVKIFCPSSLSEKEFNPSQSSFLLDELKEIAKELGAESIIVPIPNKLNAAIQFFRQNNFETIIKPPTDPKTDLTIFKYKLANTSKKRKERDDDEVDVKKQPKIPRREPISTEKTSKTEVSKSISYARYSSRVVSIPIKGKYFEFIKSGQKTIEGRINSGMFTYLREEQEIEFKNGSQAVRCKILKIKRYNSFREMLQQEGVKACLPDVLSLDKGVEVYNQIPGYEEKAKSYGVLAIQIKKLGDIS